MVALHTEAHGVRLPYRFRRRIYVAPASATLHFEYQVENLADTPMPFIWSAHPLFAIEPGMRVLLPLAAHLHPYFVVPPDLAISADGIPWPFQLDLNGR